MNCTTLAMADGCCWQAGISRGQGWPAKRPFAPIFPAGSDGGARQAGPTSCGSSNDSILQPSIATDAPVVGVATSAETLVPGSATGASHEIDIAAVVKFAVEVAKEFGGSTAEFYDAKEFARLNELYGSMHRLRQRAPRA